jgi:c-di-GMP-binding flagellar brake protein YcgR
MAEYQLLQFIAKADNSSALFVGGVFLLLILLIAIGAIRSGRNRGRGGAGKLQVGSFKKQARKQGLSKNQLHILEKAIKSQNIANPERMLTNGGFLNKVIKRLIDDVKASSGSDAQKDAVIGQAFSIKRILANQARVSTGPGSTILRQGQQITLYTSNNPPIQTIVTGNIQSYLAIENPNNPSGGSYRFPKNSEVRVRCVFENGKVYRFDSKIRQTTKIEGVNILLVEHVKNMQEVQMRRYQRKEMNRPTYFQQVEIVSEGSGKKATKRAVVNNNRKFLGQIEDISAGGCAVFSRNPLKKGALIKLSFDIGQTQGVIAFGKVLHFNVVKPLGGTMHISFTRVSTKHLNEIQAYVYGISDTNLVF